MSDVTGPTTAHLGVYRQATDSRPLATLQGVRETPFNIEHSTSNTRYQQYTNVLSLLLLLLLIALNETYRRDPFPSLGRGAFAALARTDREPHPTRALG